MEKNRSCVRCFLHEIEETEKDHKCTFKDCDCKFCVAYIKSKQSIAQHTRNRRCVEAAIQRKKDAAPVIIQQMQQLPRLRLQELQQDTENLTLESLEEEFPGKRMTR